MRAPIKPSAFAWLRAGTSSEIQPTTYVAFEEGLLENEDIFLILMLLANTAVPILFY